MARPAGQYSMAGAGVGGWRMALAHGGGASPRDRQAR